MAKALAEAEGRFRGDLDLYRSLICKLVEKRCGSLSDELRQRIHALSDIEHLRICFDLALELSYPSKPKI